MPVDELIEAVQVHEDHLEVVVRGAPKLNVKPDEVGLVSNGEERSGRRGHATRYSQYSAVSRSRRFSWSFCVRREHWCCVVSVRLRESVTNFVTTADAENEVVQITELRSGRDPRATSPRNGSMSRAAVGRGPAAMGLVVFGAARPCRRLGQ